MAQTFMVIGVIAVAFWIDDHTTHWFRQHHEDDD